MEAKAWGGGGAPYPEPPKLTTTNCAATMQPTIPTACVRYVFWLAISFSQCLRSGVCHIGRFA